MKTLSFAEQLERLEDHLQTLKWTANRPLPPTRRRRPIANDGIVASTFGLLRGRLPAGRLHERRLRREWDRRS